MVYPPEDAVTYPSTNRARRALTSFTRQTPLTTTPRRQPLYTSILVRTAYTTRIEPTNQGPDLENILRLSYDYLTIIPILRSTYDGRIIYQTSYEGRKAFLSYNLLAKL